jgi:hypothetical protein
LILVLGYVPQASAAITILENWQDVGGDEVAFYDLEHSGTLSYAYGHGSSTTTYNFRSVNGQQVYDWAFEHSLDGEGSATAAVQLVVEVDEETEYFVSGLYQQSGVSSTLQEVTIDDGGYPDLLYSSNRAPAGDSSGVAFEVGVDSDLDSGSNGFASGYTQGVLAPGRYYFTAFYELGKYPPYATGTATAIGNLHLTLGSATESAVPEPAALAIWAGMSLVGLLLRRRKREETAI